LKGEEIETKKNRLISKIISEETTQFLKETLRISGVNREFSTQLRQKTSPEQIINFRNLVFKDIVEEGIDNACIHENLPVSYVELNGNPKNDILQKDNLQGKLNALKSTLGEIDKKRRIIAANSDLQSLINKELPSDYKGLKIDLKNIRKLICQGNNVLNEIAEEKNSDGNEIKLS